MQHDLRRRRAPAGIGTRLLLTLGSLVLVLPGCLMAGLMLLVRTLVSGGGGSLLSALLLLVAWLPDPQMAGVVLPLLYLAGLALLVLVLLLLPVLTCAAGLVSTAYNIATATLWAEQDASGIWVVIAAGALGTALAAWRIRIGRVGAV